MTAANSVDHKLTKQDIKDHPVLKELGLKKKEIIYVPEAAVKEGETILEAFVRIEKEKKEKAKNDQGATGPEANTGVRGEGAGDKKDGKDGSDNKEGNSKGSGKEEGKTETKVSVDAKTGDEEEEEKEPKPGKVYNSGGSNDRVGKNT